MKVAQIYELMNIVTSEVLGRTEVVTEDLSNLVDVGNEIFNSNLVDNYVKKLVDHIGRVVFVNRPYAGSAPSVLMDAWEFGSVVEKITCDLPEASENASWSLVSGQVYDPNKFKAPDVSAKFFNNKVTFEIQMSITEIQVKESFDSLSQLNTFISMIYNAIDQSMTVKIDGLIMRAINSLIAETYADYTKNQGIKVVNLLSKYNERFGATLTAAEAVTNPEFNRYASYEIALISNRMTRLSTLFNVGGKARFTSPDYMHLVLLNDFAQGAKTYLQSDTFHEEFTALPNAEIVPYWQGTGTNYEFDSTSKIQIKLPSDGSEVTVNGVLGCIFDRDACAVCNYDRRTTSQWNAPGEFTNMWFKADCSEYVDLNEQCVVFIAA